MATMAVSTPLSDKEVIKRITTTFPCRDRQIRALVTLLSATSPSPRNIVLHGLAATGKSGVCCEVLRELDNARIDIEDRDGEERDGGIGGGRRWAVVKSQECITARHLLERVVGEVGKAVGWKGGRGKGGGCEDVGRLVEVLAKMLAFSETDEMDEDGDQSVVRKERRFTLVFDGIDKQRDAPATLLPALGRLSEVIPHLTTIFILTSPRPHFLHTSSVYISFPAYTKPETLLLLSACPPPLLTILPTPTPPLSTNPPPSLPSTTNPSTQTPQPPAPPTSSHLHSLWTRYLAAIWDTFASHSGRDILSFRYLALKLWPKFVAPVKAGRFLATDFQRLFISQRALFRDESLLVPSIVAKKDEGKVVTGTVSTGGVGRTMVGGLALPYTSQILLLAAYLCSYVPARNDVMIFSKLSAKKRRRGGASGTVKGGGARRSKDSLAQRRRIDRKLLGPQAFVVERLLAVFWCVWEEASHGREKLGNGNRKGIKELGGSADILAQIATLSSLRLLVRTGKEELDGGTKYRVNVGWEVVRSLGRGVGVELGEWLE